jgi:hypothetical protein
MNFFLALIVLDLMRRFVSVSHSPVVPSQGVLFSRVGRFFLSKNFFPQDIRRSRQLIGHSIFTALPNLSIRYNHALLNPPNVGFIEGIGVLCCG